MTTKNYRSLTSFGKAFLFISAEVREDKYYAQKILLFFGKDNIEKQLVYRVQMPIVSFDNIDDFISDQRNVSDMDLYKLIIEPNYLDDKNKSFVIFSELFKETSTYSLISNVSIYPSYIERIERVIEDPTLKERIRLFKTINSNIEDLTKDF